METRMRDLEQIQERDPQDGGRRIGTIVLASLTLVGLTFAMGVVIGQAAEPPAAVDPDPLAGLDAPALAKQPPTSEPAETEAPINPELEARQLSFPTVLTGEEERPEVLAAIAAAAAEEERLAQAAAEELSAVEAPAPVPAIAEQPIPAAEPAEITATLPAAVAAGRTARNLIESARRDQLVASAIPRVTTTVAAPRGSEGEYTLQVISYDQLAAANEFAETLRARGHQAFVMTADVPDRGRFYRVRIGPFETKHQADEYRARFEAEERMNTFVVKRPKDEEQP